MNDTLLGGRAAGAKLKGHARHALGESSPGGRRRFAAFYAHLEIKHTRAFFEPTWDFPFGDQEIHLLESGRGLRPPQRAPFRCYRK